MWQPIFIPLAVTKALTKCFHCVSVRTSLIVEREGGWTSKDLHHVRLSSLSCSFALNFAFALASPGFFNGHEMMRPCREVGQINWWLHNQTHHLLVILQSTRKGCHFFLFGIDLQSSQLRKRIYHTTGKGSLSAFTPL